MARLRVLSEHPHLGRPNDLVDEFDGAQAYIDAGYAEWADGARFAAGVETTEAAGPAETAVARPSARRAASTKAARRSS